MQILSLIDDAARYEVNAQVQRECTTQTAHAIELGWLTRASPPTTLLLESSGANMGNELRCGASSLDIELDCIPRGAHNCLGMLERNHTVKYERPSLYRLSCNTLSRHRCA